MLSNLSNMDLVNLVNSSGDELNEVTADVVRIIKERHFSNNSFNCFLGGYAANTTYNRKLTLNRNISALFFTCLTEFELECLSKEIKFTIIEFMQGIIKGMPYEGKDKTFYDRAISNLLTMNANEFKHGDMKKLIGNMQAFAKMKLSETTSNEILSFAIPSSVSNMTKDYFSVFMEYYEYYSEKDQQRIFTAAYDKFPRIAQEKTPYQTLMRFIKKMDTNDIDITKTMELAAAKLPKEETIDGFLKKLEEWYYGCTDLGDSEWNALAKYLRLAAQKNHVEMFCKNTNMLLLEALDKIERNAANLTINSLFKAKEKNNPGFAYRPNLILSGGKVTCYNKIGDWNSPKISPYADIFSHMQTYFSFTDNNKISLQTDFIKADENEIHELTQTLELFEKVVDNCIALPFENPYCLNECKMYEDFTVEQKNIYSIIARRKIQHNKLTNEDVDYIFLDGNMIFPRPIQRETVSNALLRYDFGDNNLFKRFLRNITAGDFAPEQYIYILDENESSEVDDKICDMLIEALKKKRNDFCIVDAVLGHHKIEILKYYVRIFVRDEALS